MRYTQIDLDLEKSSNLLNCSIQLGTTEKWWDCLVFLTKDYLLKMIFAEQSKCSLPVFSKCKAYLHILAFCFPFLINYIDHSYSAEILSKTKTCKHYELIRQLKQISLPWMNNFFTSKRTFEAFVKFRGQWIRNVVKNFLLLSFNDGIRRPKSPHPSGCNSLKWIYNLPDALKPQALICQFNQSEKCSPGIFSQRTKFNSVSKLPNVRIKLIVQGLEKVRQRNTLSWRGFRICYTWQAGHSKLHLRLVVRKGLDEVSNLKQQIKFEIPVSQTWLITFVNLSS